MYKLLLLSFLLTCSMASAQAEPSSGDSKSNSTKKSSAKSPNSSAKRSKIAKRKYGPVKSQAEAVAIVSAEPEVKKFVALTTKSGMKGSSSFVEFDRLEDGDYIIHVYQYVPDGDDSGHTATFNWYHVNVKTGKLSKEF